MDLTDKFIVDSIVGKISATVSENVAEIISDALKQEILEAQKYRIDKEFEIKKLELELKKQELELEEYKLNYKDALYCKTHRQFMKQVNLDDKDYLHYQCLVNGCNIVYTVDDYYRRYSGEVSF